MATAATESLSDGVTGAKNLPSDASSEQKLCAACGKTSDKLKRCKACQTVYYCDAQCQRGNWPEHRQKCQQVSGKAKDEASVNGHATASNGHAAPSPSKPSSSNGNAGNTPTLNTNASHVPKAAKVETSPSKAESASAEPASRPVESQIPAASVAESDEILSRGLELQRSEEYEGAFRELSVGVAKFPTHYKLREARALAAMLTGRLDIAETDAQEAVKLDGKSLKAKIRLMKVLLKKGALDRAVKTAEQVLAEDPTNATARQDLQHAKLNVRRMEAARAAFSEGKFREASSLTHKVTDESPGSREALLLRAESLHALGQLDEAFSVTTGILRDDEKEKTKDHALLNLRAKILFAQERFDQCMKHLQQVLQENPDDSNAARLLKRVKKLQRIKTEGDDHFKASRFADAAESYSTCLNEVAEQGGLNQFRAKLFCNRAGALSSQGKHEEAIAECDKALELDDRYVKAYTRRATSLRALGGKERLERAVADYEKIEELQGEPTAESRENIKRAKQELKQAKRKDYYSLLGLSVSDKDNLTTDDFKKAYKKMALKHHPDRHTNSTDEEKKQAEATFKDVAEALHVLGDPEKKRLYDRGFDLEEIEQRAGGGGHGHSHHGGFHPDQYDFDPDMFGGGGNPFMGGGFGGGGARGFRYGGGGYPF